MYTQVWQIPDKQHSSHTVLIKFYFSQSVINAAGAQSMNIGNVLRSCSCLIYKIVLVVLKWHVPTAHHLKILSRCPKNMSFICVFYF